MEFNKTIVATIVATTLCGATFGATAHSSEKMTQAVSNIVAAQQIKLAAKKTKSGMASHYDRALQRTTFAWANDSITKPSLSLVAPQKRLSIAADHYLNQLTGLSSAKSGISKAVLSNTHDIKHGAKVAKYKQEVAGVEVFNREYNILMDSELNLVSSSGYFAASKSLNSGAPIVKDMAKAFGDAKKAIIAAFNQMGGSGESIELSTKESSQKYQLFSAQNQATAPVQLVGQPRSKQVFFEYKNELVAAHYVEIETSSIDTVESEYYSYVISAKTGKVLFKKNLTSHAAEFNYRIYANDDSKPWDSPHGNVIPAPVGTDDNSYLSATYLDAPLVALTHGPISTMDPWLADDATTTEGNNVFAYVDAIAPQGFSNGDYTAETTSDRTFDYKFDPDQIASSSNNRKAAVVALFTVNNYLHDDFYDHGFDESSGNAQTSNYGRGGEEGDAILAEVQDNSGFNNANMSTPADGGSPRMQMYLWNSEVVENGVDYGITVTSDEALGLLNSSTRSSLGPGFFRPVTGKLVRIEDDEAPINDGCTDLVNAAELYGNIAIIDRGACVFVDKILNAQAAGAIAIIIANNRDGDDTVVLGGDDVESAITIPNMSISQNDGIAVYAAMDAADVEISMFNKVTPQFRASSWDNGIVAHEWGHYISNRLIGNGSGLDNNQGSSMGEGWGDFHALLLLSEESDALLAGNDKFQTNYSATSYIAPFTTGIRRNPYSTDMTENPATFKDIEVSSEVHDSGEIWASMLWDSYVGLINDDRHTFAQAQSLMKDYLVASYKMTPLSPTYTEARDALLSVAYSNDVDDYKVILAAFARRGMGLGAVSPDRYSTDHIGVIESYETELPALSATDYLLNNNYEGATTGYCSNDNILDQGETGTVSFSIGNDGDEALTNVTGLLTVTSGHDVTFANEGMVSFGDLALFGKATSEPIEFTLNEAGIAEELTIELTFPDASEETLTRGITVSTIVNIDFDANVLDDTIDYSGLNDYAALHDFSENVMNGGDAAQGTLTLGEWGGGDNYIHAANHPFLSDVAFETRTLQIGYAGDFSVNWYHYFNIEAQWDGGVVEVSVNGGDYVDVLSISGARFEGTGYNDTMLLDTEAAIAGRDAFTGESNPYGEMETINFGSTLNGNEVKFRFRISTDSAVSETGGWIIDDVTFDNVLTSVFSSQIAGDTYNCDNRLPMISTTSSVEQTVDEGTMVNMSVTATDANSDELTYIWTQVSGTTVEINNADTASASFTAPDYSTDESTQTFMVSISDGSDTVTQSFTVMVNDVPAPAVTPVAKRTSGGASGLLALLLIPLAFLRRRK